MTLLLIPLLLSACLCAAQPADTTPGYILGPDDQIVIRALDADEISDKPVLIDTSGYVSLPLLGRIRAAGLTVEQLEAELAERLKKYVQQPQVAITVTEFRSQPVSVIGAVNQPGVHQIRGRKTLVEVLSMAGGLRQDAGYSLKIARRLEYGRIPLPAAAADPAGQFSVAELSVKSILEASNPMENIEVKPYDVISVPRGQMVYVIGEVRKAGGFVLGDKQNVTVLQALSLAEGLSLRAKAKDARILRVNPKTAARVEIAVDLKRVLAGKAQDVPMQADDILFVPGSGTKSFLGRAGEIGLQSVLWGAIVYR